MRRLAPLYAVMLLAAAAPALAQGIARPVPTGALPSVANTTAPPAGPTITIDPRGLTGGVTGDVSVGAGALVIDTGSGAAQPLGSSTAVLPTGEDAALRNSTPTTLNPAPPTDPLCRDRRVAGCRAR